MNNKIWNKKIWSRLILSTALAGGMLFAIGTPARADRDWGPDCGRRLDADRARIDHDAMRFGERSHQVAHDVARMDSDRQWCRDHHAEWDHGKYDTGIYIHL
jgi:hypothetical protein